MPSSGLRASLKEEVRAGSPYAAVGAQFPDSEKALYISRWPPIRQISLRVLHRIINAAGRVIKDLIQEATTDSHRDISHADGSERGRGQ